MPMEEDLFQVFRRLGTAKIMPKLGNCTGDGRQTFYNKVTVNNFSVGNMTYGKRATVKRCNSFQCLQAPEFPMFGEYSEFAPIRMARPLTVKGSGGLSRDELVSKDSGIPVMGGVTGGKKIIVSGIPVMGGVVRNVVFL